MNRRYASVTPTIWTSETGREWRRLGAQFQLLALYLITNPHASLYGLYYLPLVIIVEETGLQRAVCAKVLGTFASQDFAFYDDRTEWVFVKNMAVRQLQFVHAPNPREPRVIGVRRFYEACPPNPFLGPFFDHYHELFHLDARRDGGPWSVPKSPEMSLANGTRGRTLELFEQWWAHYPKPVSKRAALTEWMAIKPTPDDAFTARCIEAVEEQKRTANWIKDGGKWIPDPERWLKKGRWDDRAPELPHLSESEAEAMTTYTDWLKDNEPE